VLGGCLDGVEIDLLLQLYPTSELFQIAERGDCAWEATNGERYRSDLLVVSVRIVRARG